MSCLLKTQPINCFGNMHCQVWFSYMPIDFSKVWGLNAAPSSRKIQEHLNRYYVVPIPPYLRLPFHLFTLLLTTSPTIYTRLHKCNHPISKALQWLAWSTKFWTGQGWSHILLCWGRFLYIPWLFVCQFSRKNLPWNVWEKVTNFSL